MRPTKMAVHRPARRRRRFRHDELVAVDVWGSASKQVNGFGNAVSPPVGEFLGGRLRAILHNEQVAA